MGDWIERSHWIVAPDDEAALAVYERLETIGAELRRGRDPAGGIEILRFGFASPRLVVAIASRKYGESVELAHEVALPGVQLLVSHGASRLIGRVEILEPVFLFAWTEDDRAARELERAGLAAVRFGAARVRAFTAAHASEMFHDPPAWRMSVPFVIEDLPLDSRVVVGVASHAHGLVALCSVCRGEPVVDVRFDAQATQLFAQRIEGTHNAVVIREDTPLPHTRLFDDLAGRLERHGVHHMWQSTAQRAAEVRSALASASPAERRAGEAMRRRWGLDARGARVAEPCPDIDRRWIDTLPATPRVDRFRRSATGYDPAWLAAQVRFREIAVRIDELAAKQHHARLRELARRFAELAHVTDRASYWMVRDGAPGPDRPDGSAGHGARLDKIWSGAPDQITDQIAFWAAAAACAMTELDRDPAAAAIAAIAAFIAFDAAVGIATGVSWIPPLGWIEAIVHAEVTLDADADIDPTLGADPDFDPVRARAALATYAEGDAELDRDPRAAATLLETARRAAAAAGAPVLAMRARYRRLEAVLEAGDAARFTDEAERLLADLPSPVSLAHYSTAGELAIEATEWTANLVAWHAHLRGDHARALEVVDRALLYATGTAWHDNIRDTKVRALLAVGRRDEAFAIVHEVLGRTPAFETFADLAASDAYRAWSANRPAATS